MTSPLSGTLAPAVSGRTEVQAISPQPYPTQWFSRSNFGGRFSGMLKSAGYDGIVVEGKAKEPTWIKIVEGEVTFEDAKGLWGMDTYSTQAEISKEITGQPLTAEGREWYQNEDGRDAGRTTQKPATMTIGPAGENETRVGALIHGAGNGAGNAAFGSVFGSKNLKAISALGTKSVDVANPSELLKARTWAEEEYASDVNDPYTGTAMLSFPSNPGGGASYAKPVEDTGPRGCLGCHQNCRVSTESGYSNESSCVDYLFYTPHDSQKHGGYTENLLKSADLAQRLGVNVYNLEAGILWLQNLNKKGVLGEGKEIDTDLDFSNLGNYEFANNLINKIAYREGIGKELSKGLPRAAKEWGRLEQDLETGTLPLQYWGYPQHYDARTEVEWGYGSILGERDINEHDFNFPCYWTPSVTYLVGMEQPISAKKLSEIIADKCSPYNDPEMVDYSDEGIYSKSMAKTVAWHRHYTRFWKQSIGFCDWAYASFINPYKSNWKGLTGEAEPKFFNAVTGKDISFTDGIEKGRKIWNLDRAIWSLQGRHRSQEKFSQYTYEVGATPGYTTYEVPYVMPVKENGEWKYKNVNGRTIDKDKFEQWKSKFYELEGWNTETGRPKRSTLENLGLSYVADELENKNKLET